MIPALKLIRRLHMYSALFLTPWMIIYAGSGLVLNHLPLVRGWYGSNFAHFEKTGEQPYTTTFSSDADVRTIAAQILNDLDLAGTFGVQGNVDSPRIVINRNGSFAQHRVTYLPGERRLTIEKQSFILPVFLNRAHFRHGFNHPYAAAQTWAFIVDFVVVAMIFWALSGVIMWWEIKPARGLGWASLAASAGVFGLLLVSI
jgi:hypothetical protein